MNTMTLSIARFICVVSLVMVLSASSQQSVCAQLSALPPQVWPQNPVTVSFAPDSVGIGIFRNEIHQHLKATMDEKQYRIEILKACQEWSRNSGINFALVGDSPRDFGTPGLSQSDPRFGDIRFGAFPQTNVLGNAIPYHPTAGTWAGDILLDTNTIYEIQSPETTQIVAERADLFSVALHELGNTIGLVDDNFDPESVMYYRYAGRRQSLSPFDVQNVQFLYGPRANDPYEDRQGNERIATASIINWSADFAINSSQTVRGRINASQDVDVYRIRGNTLSDKLWVTVNCRGLSLLCPKVTILDDEGRVIDTASSESPLDNSVTKELTSLYPDETRYLVVEWNGIPEFEFGDYELELNVNQPAVPASLWQVEDDDGQPFSDVDDESFEDRLFELAGAVDTELGTNDSPSTATQLISPIGMAPGSRYESVGTALKNDVDCFSVRAAADATGSMMVHLRPLATSYQQFSVTLLDSSFKILRPTITYHSDGDIDVELARVTPDAHYIIVVAMLQPNDTPVNYLLVTDIATTNSSLETIQQVRLTATAAEAMGTMTTYKTQLFKFALNVNSTDKVNQAVQLTIYSDTGRAEATIICKAGNSARNLIWLQAGKHTFRFTALANSGRRIVTSNTTLRGASVSDDEGPILIDPSGNPVSGPQVPNNAPPPTPLWEFPKFVLGLILPPENPWFSPPPPNRTL